MKFPVGLVGWYSNKIKSSIAEAACRAHFEALGYAVESTGIEHIAPQYCKLSSFAPGNYIGNVKGIQNLPDLIISRIHPATRITVEHGKDGKVDAVLIEAKYRNEVVLDEFTDEILTTYQNLLDKKIHFIVYLVCRRYKMKSSEPEFRNDSFVFLNFINPDRSKSGGGTGWQKAGEWPRYSELPLYQGMLEGQDFNEAYRSIVHPVLADLLG